MPASPALSFERLVSAIGQAHTELAAQASRAVNSSLTLRNWLIGFHIAEYEQQGTDRAQYGDKLLARLSDRLVQAGVIRTEARELRRYRQFYLAYPQIRESLTPELVRSLLPEADAGYIRESLTPRLGVAASEVLTKLSFTHIAELLQCDDATKRAFYEMECIRGNWSVRELKQQIASGQERDAEAACPVPGGRPGQLRAEHARRCWGMRREVKDVLGHGCDGRLTTACCGRRYAPPLRLGVRPQS